MDNFDFRRTRKSCRRKIVDAFRVKAVLRVVE
jgi:hypothetical protein